MRSNVRYKITLLTSDSTKVFVKSLLWRQILVKYFVTFRKANSIKKFLNEGLFISMFEGSRLLIKSAWASRIIFPGYEKFTEKQSIRQAIYTFISRVGFKNSFWKIRMPLFQFNWMLDYPLLDILWEMMPSKFNSMLDYLPSFLRFHQKKMPSKFKQYALSSPYFLR